MHSGEETIANFIVFSLTQIGLEAMTYRTRGKHLNHYTTNAVEYKLTKWTALPDWLSFIKRLHI